MDASAAAAWVAAGALAGAAAGLVPSLHPNTLAALAVALVPAGGLPAALAVVAAASAHAFTSLLPGTYVGVPSDEGALAAFPAHRMLREGRGRAAVRVGLDAALLGVLGAVLLLLPAKWVLAEPGRALDLASGWAPFILLGTIILLLASEARRARGEGAAAAARRVAWAAAVLVLAATLSMAASRIPLRAPLAVPASPLLPLLSGMFGLAGLVASIGPTAGVGPQAPPQALARPAERRARQAVPAGLAASGLTLAIPGLTSAVAATIAYAGRPEGRPEPVLATLSAINAAHATLAVGLLWVTSDARTGIAAAVAALAPPAPWPSGQPPAALGWCLAAALAGAGLGYGAALALDRPVARAAARVPANAVAAAGIALIVALCLLLCGGWGLPILAAAAALGLLPIAAGVRRIHLTGALLGPALVSRLGWG